MFRLSTVIPLGLLSLAVGLFLGCAESETGPEANSVPAESETSSETMSPDPVPPDTEDTVPDPTPSEPAEPAAGSDADTDTVPIPIDPAPSTESDMPDLEPPSSGDADGTAGLISGPMIGLVAPAIRADEAATPITLETLDYEAYRKRLTKREGEKLTLVDAWATWCIPCVKNFPDVVEMHEKYAKRGLQVVSLSMDDPENPGDVAKAKRFLEGQKATFTNFLLDADFNTGEGFEQLDIINIPAVFLYAPDGTEVFRFVGDDPDNMYTYADVERKVVELLDAADTDND